MELKQLSEEIKGLVNDVKSGHTKFDEAIKALNEKVLAGETSAEETAKAVEQMEKDLKELNTNVTAKISKYERIVAADGGRKYRGSLGSVETARSFGLAVGAAVLGKSNPPAAERCMEILRSDHKDLLNEKAQFDTSDAAALIPAGFRNVLVDLTQEYGVYERNCLYYPMPNASTPYPKRTSGLTVYYPDEGSAPTDSEVGVAAQTLQAKKAACLTFITNEVTEDSAIAIGEMVANEMARAFAYDHDRQGFNGDTADSAEPKQFNGIIKSLGAAAKKTGSGNAYSELTDDDFAAVMGKVLRPGATENRWFVSRQFYFTVMVPLLLDAGGRTVAETQGGFNFQFMGVPVEFTEVMPTAEANSQVCALFGSLRQGCVFGDRRMMTIKASDQYKFAEDMTTILGTRRWATKVHGAGGSSNVEAISALVTAGS